MGKVPFGLSVSLDGFIADKNDDPSEVFAWMGSAMDQFHEIVGDALNETGAVIMGRRTFDQIYSEQGWVFPDGTAPEWRVFVLQSQARVSVKKGKTSLYFVPTDIESDCASTAACRREGCGSAWGQRRATSLEGGSARRVPS